MGRNGYFFFAVGAGLPLFFADAHRAFIAAASFAFVSDDIVRLFVGTSALVIAGASEVTGAFSSLILAH